MVIVLAVKAGGDSGTEESTMGFTTTIDAETARSLGETVLRSEEPTLQEEPQEAIVDTVEDSVLQQDLEISDDEGAAAEQPTGFGASASQVREICTCMNACMQFCCPFVCR